MTEIRFYHLQDTSLEQALPKMLEMCLSRGWRARIMARSEERVAALSDHLCTELASYDLVCRLFDDRDQEAVSAARIRWMEEKEAGYKLTYWQQTNRSWEKKAEYDGDAAGS
jgi:DNA polymerase-3 subunit chi